MVLILPLSSSLLCTPHSRSQADLITFIWLLFSYSLQNILLLFLIFLNLASYELLFSPFSSLARQTPRPGCQDARCLRWDKNLQIGAKSVQNQPTDAHMISSRTYILTVFSNIFLKTSTWNFERIWSGSDVVDVGLWQFCRHPDHTVDAPVSISICVHIYRSDFSGS